MLRLATADLDGHVLLTQLLSIAHTLYCFCTAECRMQRRKFLVSKFRLLLILDGLTVCYNEVLPKLLIENLMLLRNAG